MAKRHKVRQVELEDYIKEVKLNSKGKRMDEMDQKYLIPVLLPLRSVIRGRRVLRSVFVS